VIHAHRAVNHLAGFGDFDSFGNAFGRFGFHGFLPQVFKCCSTILLEPSFCKGKPLFIGNLDEHTPATKLWGANNLEFYGDHL
jgi:hypothetical protein